jgi:hypothetical protein
LMVSLAGHRVKPFNTPNMQISFSDHKSCRQTTL